MSSNPTNLVASPQTPTEAIIDTNTGRFNWAGIKWAQGITQAVNNALTLLGVFNGIIGNKAQIQGRVGTLANITQNLTATGQLQATHLTGVVQPAQLPAADPLTQGAVIAPGNVLGTAALQPDTAFDPAGAANTAQTASFAHADAGDVTTLAAAKTYTDGKFPGVAAHTITLVKLTTGGTDGSITWDANGVVIGFVDPT